MLNFLKDKKLYIGMIIGILISAVSYALIATGVLANLGKSVTSLSSSAISAMAAMVSAVATWLAFMSAKKNQEISQQLISPHVAVYVQSEKAGKNLIDIVVRNDGGGIARNIKFHVSGDDLELTHQAPGYEKLSKLRSFTHGIKALSPRQERKYYILSVTGQYEQILQKETIVEIEYWNADLTRKYADSFTLDFASLSEADWHDDNERAPKRIADELKKLNDTINRAILLDGFDKVKKR